MLKKLYAKVQLVKCNRMNFCVFIESVNKTSSSEAARGGTWYEMGDGARCVETPLSLPRETVMNLLNKIKKSKNYFSWH